MDDCLDLLSVFIITSRFEMTDVSGSNSDELHKNAFNILNNRLLKPTSNYSRPTSNNPIIAAQRKSSLYNASSAESLSDKAQPTKSLGKGWFGLEPMKLDDNVKRDIKMIQMRNYMDPKRCVIHFLSDRKSLSLHFIGFTRIQTNWVRYCTLVQS